MAFHLRKKETNGIFSPTRSPFDSKSNLVTSSHKKKEKIKGRSPGAPTPSSVDHFNYFFRSGSSSTEHRRLLLSSFFFVPFFMISFRFRSCRWFLGRTLAPGRARFTFRPADWASLSLERLCFFSIFIAFAFLFFFLLSFFARACVVDWLRKKKRGRSRPR